MLFKKTKFKGVFIIEPERLKDRRGFFARAFCRKEFERHGLNSRIVQSSISFNKKKGTLRGIHYQAFPHQEAKVVSCTRGAIYDVLVDLRPDSSTFKQWLTVELTADNHRTLYVPEGVAHGFQTLRDNTEVLYQMFEFYYPKSARGVRWNDPAIGIQWPLKNCIISPKDQRYPNFTIFPSPRGRGRG